MQEDQNVDQQKSTDNHSKRKSSAKAERKKPSKGTKKAGIQSKIEPFQSHLSRAKILGVVVIIALSMGFGYLGGTLGTHQASQSNSLPVNLDTHAQTVVTSQSKLYSKIVQAVSPSVVSIDVTGQTTQQGMFGISQNVQTESAGTGIILTKSGLIITNRHVVPAGSQTVDVTLSDGTQYKNVKVVGRTSSSDPLDIAFLQIQNTNGKTLTPITVGNSSQVKIGDQVLAIGNALGQFQNTVTSGIISGYGRQVQASSQTGSTTENLQDLFQTDAAINEGNSGGPLVNMSGQVIGINTATAGNAQNIGFAIPINDVKGLIASVEKTGKLQRPYLGVRYVMLTPDVAYQLHVGQTQGAYIVPSTNGVQSVVAGSPAARAGLKPKDIITKVNNVTLNQNHTLVSEIGQYQVGDKITLTILRNGKTFTLTATLGAEPTSGSNI